MPYDEKGRFWLECRDGVYSDSITCYKPPPDGEPPDPSPPMFIASQEAIDEYDRKHNHI